MESIVFNCETVTPLVMNGAYGNNDPELRPPGIKASLRFWWRALHGHLPLEDQKERNSGKIIQTGLRTKESEIFGSTKGRSKVIIRVEENIDKEIISSYLLPHKPTEREKSPARAFKEGLPFKIRIDFDETKISSEKIKNLFVLACTLGGWGKRSRRGFGSVMVTEIDGHVYSSPTTIDEIYNLLDKNYFEKANNTIYSNFRRNEPYPFLKSIEIGQNGFNTTSELLKKIGSSSSTAKSENNDSWDYRNSLGHTSKSKRFASPYYVTVIKSGELFYPLFTSLNISTENGNTPRNATKIQDAFKNRIV